MTDLTASEREKAFDLARRALDAAERNRAEENPNAGELAALEANAQKQTSNRALLGIHERPIDQGDEDDD